MCHSQVDRHVLRQRVFEGLSHCLPIFVRVAFCLIIEVGHKMLSRLGQSMRINEYFCVCSKKENSGWLTTSRCGSRLLALLWPQEPLHVVSCHDRLSRYHFDSGYTCKIM